MVDQKQAYGCALSAVLIWSTVATAFKLSLNFLSVLQLLFFASGFSGFILYIILLVQKKGLLLKKIKKKDLVFSVWLGLLNPFAYYLVLFKAYQLLPAQEAQSLNYTWAITLSLLAVPFLKQRLHKIDLFAMLISYCGVYLIAAHGRMGQWPDSNPVGIILALVSTVIWSGYWLLNARDRLDPVVRLFLNFIFGTLFIGIVLGSAEGFCLPAWQGLLGALYVGCFEMGFTFVLWNTALKLSSSAAKISILIYLSPFLSLVFIHYFLQEEIMGSTIVGLFLIVGGIVVQQLFRTKAKGSTS